MLKKTPNRCLSGYKGKPIISLLVNWFHGQIVFQMLWSCFYYSCVICLCVSFFLYIYLLHYMPLISESTSSGLQDGWQTIKTRTKTASPLLCTLHSGTIGNRSWPLSVSYLFWYLKSAIIFSHKKKSAALNALNRILTDNQLFVVLYSSH